MLWKLEICCFENLGAEISTNTSYFIFTSYFINQQHIRKLVARIHFLCDSYILKKKKQGHALVCCLLPVCLCDKYICNLKDTVSISQQRCRSTFNVVWHKKMIEQLNASGNRLSLVLLYLQNLFNFAESLYVVEIL